MTAIAWNRSETAENGIMPFDGRRHLRQVAELISMVFADELDANGRGALQEMQWVSRLSPFLGSLLSSTFFSDFVLGYVWVEGGKVVGNVTFQRADFSGSRWRISNVGVAPDYRGRGIARKLMQATLREIAQRGGNWAVLQVRVDNPPARHLYESLGFTDVCKDGVWQRPPAPIVLDDRAGGEMPPDVVLQPLGMGNWQDRVDLARSARTPLAHWADPLEPSGYQPNLSRLIGEAAGNLTGLQRVGRWGAWHEGRLAGAVEVTADSTGGSHRLRFDVHPAMRGHLERALVVQALRLLRKAPLRPTVSEHSGDDLQGVSVLESFGFRPQRVLLTMRRLMTSGPLTMGPFDEGS